LALAMLPSAATVGAASESSDFRFSNISQSDLTGSLTIQRTRVKDKAKLEVRRSGSGDTLAGSC
jgi:hypothetical protein